MTGAMPARLTLAGWVLLHGELVRGHVEVEGGRVVAAAEGPSPARPDLEGLVLPGLADHHTHAGDAAVPPPPAGATPQEVFAPPDGYKHRMLASIPRERLVVGMADYLDRLRAFGTVEHADFREGGAAGAGMFEVARSRAAHPPVSRVWGRPPREAFDRRELDALLPRVHGLGLSAVRDWHWAALRDTVAHARAAGRPVALHCSEVVREELSRVLELGPDHLVHMVHATDQDLRDLAAARVPVAVCPRSVGRFGLRAPVLAMRRAGVAVRLGTDNAMLQTPDVLAEVAHLMREPEVAAQVPLMEALSWALPVPVSKTSYTHHDIGVRIGAPDLALFPSAGDHPTELLSQGRIGGASLVMVQGRIWRI